MKELNLLKYIQFKVYTLLMICIVLMIAYISFLCCDHLISNFFYKYRTHSIIHIAKIITNTGIGLPYYIVFISLYLIGTIVTNEFFQFDYRKKNTRKFWNKIKRLSLLTIVALILSGIPLLIIKSVVGRMRPYEYYHLLAEYNHIHELFIPFTINPDYLSFPSGHTQVVFCVFTMLGLFWKKLNSIFFIVATIVALTRIMILSHYLSDIIVGALIGVIVSQLVYYKANNKLKINYSNHEND